MYLDSTTGIVPECLRNTGKFCVSTDYNTNVEFKYFYNLTLAFIFQVSSPPRPQISLSSMFSCYKWHFELSQLPKQGTWKSFPTISSLSLFIYSQSLLPGNSFSKSTSFHSHCLCSSQDSCLYSSSLMLALTNSTHFSSLCLSNVSEGATSPIISQGHRGPLDIYRAISALPIVLCCSQTPIFSFFQT